MLIVSFNNFIHYRHINRVADVKEDALESLYEKRSRKKSLATDNTQLEVDPVDALPVKTLDGEVYYRKGNWKSGS